MRMVDAASPGDVFITVTGCQDVITTAHFSRMKNNARLCNAGNFDCEVDVGGSEQWQSIMSQGRPERRLYGPPLGGLNAIGVAHPVSVLVDTHGTGVCSDETLSEIVDHCFDLRPSRIISYRDLRRPIYEQTAVYGQFGRPELNLLWEKLNKVDELKACL